MKLTTTVNFTNILLAAWANPKSAKRTHYLTVFFVFLGSVRVRAVSKMLVKLTPTLSHSHTYTHTHSHAQGLLKCSSFCIREDRALIPPAALWTHFLSFHTSTSPLATTWLGRFWRNNVSILAIFYFFDAWQKCMALYFKPWVFQTMLGLF